MSTTTKPRQLVEVILAKPHKHAGVDYATGDKIKVTERDRAWLAKHSVIEAPAPAKGGDK